MKTTVTSLAILVLLISLCLTANSELPRSETRVDGSLPNFPHAVSFEGFQDVFKRNAIGDAIVITAVHGTSKEISIGETYRIDGAYTLASQDEASLAAYVTSKDPDAPDRYTIPGQSVRISKGSGTFTVHLKVEDRGCPHVSFYPIERGNSFAGEYFGTGDFVPPNSWRLSNKVAAK